MHQVEERRGRRGFIKVALAAGAGGSVAATDAAAAKKRAVRKPTLLNGKGAPKAKLGGPGDYYVDTVAELLYGPKVKVAKKSKVTGWGNPVNLRGLPGATGPSGPAGTPGAAGPAGSPGAAGTPGSAGPAGSTGAPGASGTPGANGAPGAQGTPGTSGAPGAMGLGIIPGRGAPAATLGRDGEFYIDGNTAQLYGPKTGGVWGSPANLTGPAGPSDNAVYRSLAAEPEQLFSGGNTRTAAGQVKTAEVLWPDGTPGEFKVTGWSADFAGAIDAYTVTYGNPATRTYTQPQVTRNPSTGVVTNRPAITVN